MFVEYDPSAIYDCKPYRNTFYKGVAWGCPSTGLIWSPILTKAPSVRNVFSVASSGVQLFVHIPHPCVFRFINRNNFRDFSFASLEYVALRWDLLIKERILYLRSCPYWDGRPNVNDNVVSPASVNIDLKVKWLWPKMVFTILPIFAIMGLTPRGHCILSIWSNYTYYRRPKTLAVWISTLCELIGNSSAVVEILSPPWGFSRWIIFGKVFELKHIWHSNL